jgi:hypothetical protein
MPKQEQLGGGEPEEKIENPFNNLEINPENNLPSETLFREVIDGIEKQSTAKVVGLDNWDSYQESSGKLTGVVTINASGERQQIPIFMGRFLGQGKDSDGKFKNIVSASNIENIDGKINGGIELEGERPIPRIAGKKVTEIEGNEILGCSYVKNIGNRLNGSVLVFMDRQKRSLPVINGELVSTIGGEKVIGCYFVENVDSKLNGAVQTIVPRATSSGGLGRKEHMFPVINGNPIYRIGGKEITSCYDVKNIDGKLNGRVKFDAGWIPVIGGQLVTEIDGKKVLTCLNIKNIGGKINGSVKLGEDAVKVDGKEIPVLNGIPIINGNPIYEIGGQRIIDSSEVNNIGGTLSGKIKTESQEGWLPVIGGIIISEIGGQRITDCQEVHNVCGKLNGRVKISGQNKWVNVVLGEIK